MKLTSPLGTAGIRGTMFQLMAVRNSVTGDIMGGINLISGDIDFTDTGGNMVSLLSGQSIQLATSKLGAPVASQTGELVDFAQPMVQHLPMALPLHPWRVSLLTTQNLVHRRPKATLPRIPCFPRCLRLLEQAYPP
jgi:hypothetical protein